MRVLWLSPFAPSPDARHAGGRAMYQWLSGLAPKHDVTLLCRVDEREAAGLDAVEDVCREVEIVPFTRPAAGAACLPRIVASYVRLGRRAARRLRHERFDLLHAEYVETGVGLPRHGRVPSVLVAHDELTKPARRRRTLSTGLRSRVGGALYARAIARLERGVCRKFDRVLTLSEHDRRGLLTLDPELRVDVLPCPPGIDPRKLTPDVRAERLLLFVGALQRDANVDAVSWLASEILPAIRRAVPGVRLAIVGADPPPEIRRLARDPGIRVTGFVPALEPYYARATIFVAPVRVGGGVIVKNLDAMAAGCPVVTTTIGNEGIGARPGQELLVGDDAAAFAASVVTLFGDRAARERLAAAARAFVGARFTIESCLASLERAHREACVAGGRRGR